MSECCDVDVGIRWKFTLTVVKQRNNKGTKTSERPQRKTRSDATLYNMLLWKQRELCTVLQLVNRMGTKQESEGPGPQKGKGYPFSDGVSSFQTPDIEGTVFCVGA